MLGKPSFAFNPKFIDLPLCDKFKEKLIFSEEETLLNYVKKVLNNNWKNNHMTELKNLFDPYCDGRAVKRTARYLEEVLKH